MTPTQKIKWLVLDKAAQRREEDPPPYPCDDVDDLFAAAEGSDEICDALYDALGDVRASGEDTDIETKGWNRNYECKSIAAQLPDGSWVGWTYWYGGGKHDEPQNVPWMEDAYDVTMREEKRVVRVFAKSDGVRDGE